VSVLLYGQNKPGNLRYKVLSGYYFIGAVLMIKASLLNRANIPNIGIYDFMFLLTSLCIGFFFYLTLLSQKKKAVIIGICCIDAVYYILNDIVFKGSALFDSTGYVILSVGIVVMIFMFMHQILTNVSDESLWFNFEFWFVSSLLIYFLGSFVIFLSFNYLTRRILPDELYVPENRDLLTALWGVHNVLLFLSSLLTLGSVLWISFRKKLL